VKINLDNKTVLFEEGVTVSADNLRWLLSLLDGAPEMGTVELVPRTWSPPKLVTVERMTHAKSYNTGQTYVQVRMSDGSLACSCPDWMYRKSNQNGINAWCKHIHTAISLGRL
jgi:hypothetical protein